MAGWWLPAAAGGAAHSFEVAGYRFDAGPSFHMGLADPPGRSANPLKQVLDLVGESVDCHRYDQVGGGGGVEGQQQCSKAVRSGGGTWEVCVQWQQPGGHCITWARLLGDT
jgi:hypothetical protein